MKSIIFFSAGGGAIFAANAAVAATQNQQPLCSVAFQTLWGSKDMMNKNRKCNLLHHDGMNKMPSLTPSFLASHTKSQRRLSAALFVKASSSSGNTEDDVGTEGETDSISNENDNDMIGDEDIWISGGESGNFYSDFETEPINDNNTDNTIANNDNPNVDNNNNNSNKNDADTLLLASLKKRTAQLQSQSLALRTHWTTPTTKSSVHLQLDDWIRRIDIHKWPLAVVGTANGSIRLVNLEAGDVLAMVEGAHSRLGGNPVALRYLHGEWDGGGPLAVAIMMSSANGSGGRVVVVSAGREGAAKVWRLDTAASGASSSPFPSEMDKKKKEADGNKSDSENKKSGEKAAESTNTPAAQLTSLGEISSLKNSMVTSLHIDSDSCLWIGTYDDSTVHGFDLGIPSTTTTSSSSSSTSTTSSEEEPISLKRTMKIKLDNDKHILCMAVNEDIGLIAVGTARGTVELISMEDKEILGTWNPYSGSTHVRSVAIVPLEKENGWCLVCGGGDGTMHILRNLAIDEVSGLAIGLQGSGGGGGSGDDEKDVDDASFCWSEEIAPRHKGMVVSLAPCGDKLKGLFVSGAHDGTLRLWDCDGNDKSEKLKDGGGEVSSSSSPELLYQLVGYKVWLGNVRVDSEGKRLLSDGSDNSVVVHDFSQPEEEEKKEN